LKFLYFFNFPIYSLANYYPIVTLHYAHFILQKYDLTLVLGFLFKNVAQYLECHSEVTLSNCPGLLIELDDYIFDQAYFLRGLPCIYSIFPFREVFCFEALHDFVKII
jgi:hypothetical protein